MAIFVIVSTVLLGILIWSLPALTVWLIAKNGNSQHGKDLHSANTSQHGGQVINPVCKSGCAAFGNLFVPKP
jgi:hypothetical protein